MPGPDVEQVLETPGLDVRGRCLRALGFLRRYAVDEGQHRRVPCRRQTDAHDVLHGIRAAGSDPEIDTEIRFLLGPPQGADYGAGVTEDRYQHVARHVVDERREERKRVGWGKSG